MAEQSSSSSITRESTTHKTSTHDHAHNVSPDTASLPPAAIQESALGPDEIEQIDPPSRASTSTTSTDSSLPPTGLALGSPYWQTLGARVREWIAYCSDMHRECGQRELDGVFPAQSAIMLIDTYDMRLVTSNTGAGFVALSYVWGSVPQFTATRQHVEALGKRDALRGVWDDLAPVVQDAVTLTRWTRERYLWVDTLCIVQDDAARKAQQLALMADIYNSAVCTIVSAGSDAAARLEAELAPRSRSSLATIRAPRDVGPILEAIRASRHSTRGWTFQERVLSRRKVYFLHGKVVFVCREDVFGEGEDSAAEVLPRNPHNVTTFHARYAYDVVQARYEEVLEAWEGREPHAELEWPRVFTAASAVGFWMQVVREYSRTRLSVESDVWNACAGVMVAFEKQVDGVSIGGRPARCSLLRWWRGEAKGEARSSDWTSVGGIPLAVLEVGLLWKPGSIPHRRMSPDGQPVFPSWSWLGWRTGTAGVDFVVTDLVPPESSRGLRRLKLLSVQDGRGAVLAENGPEGKRVLHGARRDRFFRDALGLDLAHGPQLVLHATLQVTSHSVPAGVLDYHLATRMDFEDGQIGCFRKEWVPSDVELNDRLSGKNLILHSNGLPSPIVAGIVYEVSPWDEATWSSPNFRIISLYEKVPFTCASREKWHKPALAKSKAHRICVVLFVKPVAGFWERVAIGEVFQHVWETLDREEMQFLLR